MIFELGSVALSPADGIVVGTDEAPALHRRRYYIAVKIGFTVVCICVLTVSLSYISA